MSYVEDMLKLGFWSKDFVAANNSLKNAYYSALETIEAIGFGRLYVMRYQLDAIRQKAEAELFDELNTTSRDRQYDETIEKREYEPISDRNLRLPKL